ncbi:hypothetical protein CN326_12630 [Bacillus sp. AFS018417]|nr:hypothetical protein CN326_12630 [Bacillus sp. AFS018417]
MQRETKKICGGTTARKSPIGSTNHQWRMKKTPTDGSFTLYFCHDILFCFVSWFCSSNCF